MTPFPLLDCERLHYTPLTKDDPAYQTVREILAQNRSTGKPDTDKKGNEDEHA